MRFHLALTCFLFSTSLYASGLFNQRSCPEVKTQQQEDVKKALGEIFFNASEDPKMFFRSLKRDQHCCLVSLEKFKDFPTHSKSLFDSKARRFVSGNIHYRGFNRTMRDIGRHFVEGADSGSSGNYSYHITRTSPRGFLVEVAIHFKNWNKFPKGTQEDLQQRLKRAAKVFKDDAPYGHWKIDFKFSVVKKPEEAHFPNITLKDVSELDMVGPYDTSWNINWNEKVLAHEIGHMLGLDDEYDTTCGDHSMMCNQEAPHANFLRYHFYQILGRLYCQG